MPIIGVLASSVEIATGSFESIATATGTGSADTITFSSIPSTFQHLQIRGITRNTTSGIRADFGVRLNGDTGNNYAYHIVTGNGSSASAFGTGSSNNMFVGWTPASSVSSDIVGATIIDILDYTSTIKYKTIRTISGSDFNLGTTDSAIRLSSGLWMNTSAISSVTLRAPFGSWGTKTTFALYGIKGA